MPRPPHHDKACRNRYDRRWAILETNGKISFIRKAEDASSRQREKADLR